MTRYAKTELVLNKQFNSRTCRQKIDGTTFVLHCHHYATLYSQLAEDCSMLDGKALLAECAEDAIAGFLKGYYGDHGATDIATRIAIAEQTFAAFGLGKMKVACAGVDSGEVTLAHSHVDAGWLKKWGGRDKPVNFIGSGFIAGMFAAIFDRPIRTYVATETQSIVCGAPRSCFTVCVR